MTDSQQNHGPAKGVITIGQRIVTTLVSMVETRVRLAVAELEEEKANLIQMLLMLGLTMLFTAFGLMSLMVLIIWAVDAQYRLMAIAITTGVLFLLALILGSGHCVNHASRRCCVIRVKSWPTIVICLRITANEPPRT